MTDPHPAYLGSIHPFGGSLGCQIPASSFLASQDFGEGLSSWRRRRHSQADAESEELARVMREIYTLGLHFIDLVPKVEFRRPVLAGLHLGS